MPGSHDLPLLTATLDALTQMVPGTSCSLPSFDKGRDTRYPPSHWIRVRTPPDLILFEGWLLGLGPQSETALCKAQNALEQNEDSDGRWRREVNRRLADYCEIWQRLDALVVLQAPSLQTAWGWRSQVEAELRKQQSPRAMTTPQLERFLDHYERLSRHALFNLPTQADLLLQLDCKRNVSRSETH